MEKIITIKSKFLRNLFDQNTYVLQYGKEAVIIDAGAELEDVLTAVGKCKVLAILITHIHFDHFWNLDKYIEEFNCPVYISDGFEWKFADSKANGASILRTTFEKNIPQNNLKYYAKKLDLGKFKFEIFATPGHSKDSVCILWNKNLFTGDTVFADSIGRTDLIDSDNSDMINSLQTIKNIDYNLVYPGHYQEFDKNQANKVIDYYL